MTLPVVAMRPMWAAVVALLVTGCGPAGNGSAARPDDAAVCDRPCLEAVAGRYLSALAARDAGSLELAQDVRYTENGQELGLDDGLWATASEIGAYRQVFADSRGDELGLFATLRENGNMILLASRLKLAGGRIAEIESIVSRPAGGTSAGLQKLEREGSKALWDAPVPATERMTREDLATTANKYFVGLEKNDGRGEYPFTPDCYRLENGNLATGNPEMARMAEDMEKGTLTARPGGPSTAFAYRLMSLPCKQQFETGYMKGTDRIRERRFPVVDIERGVVFTLVFFDHTGTVHEVTTTDGVTHRIGLRQPFTWEIAEAFKIEKGEIRAIEAVLTQAPYGMKPNWP